MNRLTFLGTGTSTGVPMLRCKCPTCTSTDPRDKRTRTSAVLSYQGASLLIDCSPDVWMQLLRAGAPPVDAILVTHIHYDHVGGLDDMRPYCTTGATSAFSPGTQRPTHRRIPLYCRADVAADIRSRIPYCFAEKPYPGVPAFDMHIITDDQPFTIAGTDIAVQPLPVTHAPGMTILGYKFGDDLAYITDCKTMPQATADKIRGIPVLVINALRPEPHPSHMSLAETLDTVAAAAPGRAYLTHMSHDMPPQAQVDPTLPANVAMAYDGLTVDF